MATAERVEAEDKQDEEMNKILKWLHDSENSTAETSYREVSKEDYKFYAGDQDTDEVLKKLEDAKRPDSTFNEVKPKIDMLVGMAAQAPASGMAVPVGAEDEAFTELMNGTLKHYQRKLKIQRKELKAFEHVCKGGRSLLWFWLDTSNPFQPRIKARRWRGDQFYLDPNAEGLDLTEDGDHRYLFLEKWVSEEELKILDTDIPIEQLRNTTRNPDMPTFFNEARDLYRLMECWFWQYEKAYWFINPLNNQLEMLLKSNYTAFKKTLKEGIPLDDAGENVFMMDQDQIDLWERDTRTSYIKDYYYCIFSGSHKIERERSPLNWRGIPGVLYAGYKDDDRNSWFGAVSMMKDPQRSLNTTRRQLVHLLQTLPKGILMHETGAVLDIERYQSDSSDPGYHMELQRGGIGRVKFEKQPTISNIYQVLDGTFKLSIKDSSGIQDDLMGVEPSSREPGITLRARQETGFAVLFILFDNLRESRHSQTRLLLSLIQQYVTAPEVIRITGLKGARLMEINTQLNPDAPGFNDVTALQYDIEVDDVAETTTMRMAVAQILTDFARNNPNTIPPDIILEYANMPFTVKQRVLAFWEEERERAFQLEMEKLKIERIKAEKANISTRGE